MYCRGGAETLFTGSNFKGILQIYVPTLVLVENVAACSSVEGSSCGQFGFTDLIINYCSNLLFY